MCEIGFSFGQMTAVDYSAPIAHDDITFLSHSPRLVKRSWMVASIFRWQVWITIGGTFFTVSTVLYLIYHKVPHSYAPIYAHIALKLYGIYLKQCKQTNKRANL